MADSTDAQSRAKGVFISYRRGETSGQARALHDRLSQRFGAERVFMDVDSIAPGADFVQKIEEAIGSSGVALVLIGRDWLSREPNQRLLDDPTDFIRLETDTALRSGVPVIPILVERARMPAPEELPEPLRPLTRRNALELENQRWEYDVGRLVQAVERLVDPVPVIPKPDPVLVEPDKLDKPTRKRSRALVLAGLGALVVAIAVVVVLLSQPAPHPIPLEISAGHAVAAVPSDRMAALLVENRLDPSEMPSNVSALKPELASFRAYGLVAAIYIPLFGPASDLYLYYFVFDNPGDASSYYATYPPLPIHYTRTGHFVPGGIGDSKKCDTGFEASTLGQVARWEASCESLSAKVVSFVVVASTTASTSLDKRYSATLARDVIRHLLRVADAAPRASLTSPPGSLTPAGLLGRIYSSPVINGLLPPTITLSSLQRFNLGSNSPPGLVAETYLRATLASQSSRDSVLFYVFDTSRSAQAFYKTRPIPTGYSYTQNGSIDSSGFSQPASCGRYREPASSSSAASFISGCAVLWGDVIAFSEAGPSSNSSQDADTLAVTLARMAVIELGSLDSN